MLVPTHVGFIMDGNGRWARERGLPRHAGHRAGLEHIREVLRICHDHGIDIVSAYFWSTENWTRPNSEVRWVMHYLRTFGPQFAQELHAMNVRVLHTGSREDVSQAELQVIDQAVELTQNNGPRILNLVFNCGGRTELVHAVRQLMAQQIELSALNEQVLAAQLYTQNLPDIDLIIRSGGDRRSSNFLLWQSAFAWVYVAKSYWPALNRTDIQAALAYYNRALAVHASP
jgi:undecaprenyl diphosphate synthase